MVRWKPVINTFAITFGNRWEDSLSPSPPRLPPPRLAPAVG